MIRRYGFFALALALTVLTPECAKSAQPTVASVTTTVKARLIGRWTLAKHGHFDHSGRYLSTGDHMIGQLIYAPDGSMSVLIMKVPEPERLSDIIAYSGTFSVENNKVLHHIKVASEPKRVNVTVTRMISFRNNDLILSTSPDAGGYWEMVWQK